MTTPQNLFTDLLARFEASGTSADVTHYALTLGDQNATTGCYAQTYAEGATISMIIVTKAAQRVLFGTGITVKRDAVGLTDTQVAEGDEVKDAFDAYWTVQTVTPHPWGDSTVVYEAQLTINPHHA